jgi:ribosome assembly protein YihI (activator of Der GTPase)
MSQAAVTLLAGERSELLARKHGGKILSAGEQKHLDELTARLKELLPPVSLRELEALLEMAEKVNGIRERARERRCRLGS